MRYVAVINHDSRGRVAPEGRVIYYGNVPNGRDISHLCRHNWFLWYFPVQTDFSVYVSRGLLPRALCRRLSCCLLPPWTAIFPLPPLTLPLLPFSIGRSPATVVTCSLSPRLLTAYFNPRRYVTLSSLASLSVFLPRCCFLRSLPPFWNAFRY